MRPMTTERQGGETTWLRAPHDGNLSRSHLLLQRGAQRGSARPSLLEYPKSPTTSHQVLPLPAPNASRNTSSELVSSFPASVLQEPRDGASSDTAPGWCSPAAEETPATSKNHRTQDDSYQTHQLVPSIGLPGTPADGAWPSPHHPTNGNPCNAAQLPKGRGVLLMPGIPQRSGSAGSRGAHEELWLNAMPCWCLPPALGEAVIPQLRCSALPTCTNDIFSFLAQNALGLSPPTL